jgi:hypothetical protein
MTLASGAALKGATKDDKGAAKSTEDGMLRASFEDKLLLSDTVGWCRLTVSKPAVKAPIISALETIT